MFQSVKLWKLSGALKSRDVQTAYSAVRELGRMKHPKAVEVLIQALSGPDGIARAAARELGTMGAKSAVEPLVALLSQRDLNQSATEALVRLGPAAVERLSVALSSDDPMVRSRAAQALGEIGDRRPVERLIDLVQGDNEYSVRTAAATALGRIKDPRAIWVLVATLKLRDETSEDRHRALDELRQAASLAMRKIGDPLAERTVSSSGAATAAEAVSQLEGAVTESEIHPRLIGDPTLLSVSELTDVLKDLVKASEEISWAKLENRPPILDSWFRSYDLRRLAAEQVGAELARRGGLELLKEVLEKHLGNYESIRNWWEGLGLR